MKVMTPTSKRRRGLSIVEVLVTGTLFGIILTMVAQAMVVGQRSQRTVSQKLVAVRNASLALDRIVRDCEAAVVDTRVRLRNPVSMNFGLTQIQGPREFAINRFHNPGAIGTPPVEVVVGYWMMKPPTELGTLQRMMYQANGFTPFSDFTATGRSVAMDVRDFRVSKTLNPATGLSTIVVELSVSTVGAPVKAEVSLEGP